MDMRVEANIAEEQKVENRQSGLFVDDEGVIAEAWSGGYRETQG